MDGNEGVSHTYTVRMLLKLHKTKPWPVIDRTGTQLVKHQGGNI